VTADVTYMDEDYNQLRQETKMVETARGTALLSFSPPAKAVRMTIYAHSGDASASKEITAAYSPSGNFIHVRQQDETALAVGDTVKFSVLSTAQALL
jgi:hypothetical protein